MLRIAVVSILALTLSSCTDNGTHYGSVVANAFRSASEMETGGYAVAAFSSTCSPRVEGACELWTCSAMSAYPARDLSSVGTINVSDASGPIITMTPESDNSYDTGFDSDPPTPLFPEADSLVVQASGDEVPAFSVRVVAPNNVTVTQPSETSPLDVDLATGLTVHWTGTSTGDMVLRLSGGVGEGEVDCRFPAADSSGTVPASALALIPAGHGFYSFSTEGAQTVRLGDWETHVRAMFESNWPSQNLASGSANFQRRRHPAFRRRPPRVPTFRHRPRAKASRAGPVLSLLQVDGEAAVETGDLGTTVLGLGHK